VAAITGAGSGIGRALAGELAGQGARLALSDIDEIGLAETDGWLSSACGLTDALRIELDIEISGRACRLACINGFLLRIGTVRSSTSAQLVGLPTDVETYPLAP